MFTRVTHRATCSPCVICANIVTGQLDLSYVRVLVRDFVYLSFGCNEWRNAFVGGDLLQREQCGLTTEDHVEHAHSRPYS